MLKEKEEKKRLEAEEKEKRREERLLKQQQKEEEAKLKKEEKIRKAAEREEKRKRTEEEKVHKATERAKKLAAKAKAIANKQAPDNTKRSAPQGSSDSSNGRSVRKKLRLDVDTDIYTDHDLCCVCLDPLKRMKGLEGPGSSARVEDGSMKTVSLLIVVIVISFVLYARVEFVTTLLLKKYT